MDAAGGGELRVFAGIDEAGLGPILGPLTLGFSVFRAPAEHANLWRSLKGLVAKNPTRDKTHFIVADSKVVFTRNPRGAKRLEKTALGFLALLDEEGKPPRTGLDLAWNRPREIACPQEVIERHPWYAELERELPRHWELGALELKTERLARAMRNKEIELLDAGVRVLPEFHLNRSFDDTDNKSLSLWHQTIPLVRWLFKRHAADGLALVVDRQGGRFHYAAPLRDALPGCSIEVVREKPALSEYKVQRGPRRMWVRFAERAEARSFAVALGSCIAKYARETCMEAFNAYFGRLDPALKPTAGYTTDGRRWLEDAAPVLERAALPQETLVRRR